MERAKQDSGAWVFAIYVVGAGALVTVSFLALPASSGLRFLEIWTAFVLLFPVGFTWHRFGVLAAAAVTVCAWSILALQLFYTLFGLSMLAFASIWLDGWRQQQEDSSDTRRLAGYVAGAAFLLLALGVTASQLSRIPEIDRFRHLEASEVSRIDLVAQHGDLRGQVVEVTDPAAIEAIVGTFSSTYPYHPNHDSASHYEPWRMRVQLTGGRLSEDVVLGSRTSDSADVVYMDFDDGRGTFHNHLLRVALTSQVPELADW